MSVERAIACMVLLIVVLVAACVVEKSYRDKRSRRRALEDSRASDLRAIRSLRLGARLLLVLISTFLAGLVALYVSIIFELDIWGYIIGMWSWT